MMSGIKNPMRPAVLGQIQRELDNTHLPSSLFSIVLNDGDQIVRVEYLPDARYFFILEELEKPTARGQQFKTIECPGDLTSEAQVFDHETLGHGRGRIASWAQRIAEDLGAAHATLDDIDTLRDKILEDLQKQLEDQPTGMFTRDEAQAMNDRLDALEERVKVLLKDGENTRRDEQRIHNTVERLKQSVVVLDKRTWMLGAVGRIVSIMKELKMAKNEISDLLEDGRGVVALLSNGAAEGEAEDEVEEGDTTL